MKRPNAYYSLGLEAGKDILADFVNPYCMNGQEDCFYEWEAGFKAGLKVSRPRTLADLEFMDFMEWEATPEGRAALDKEMREEAAADMETERRSAAYWEENMSPAYQQECMDDMALFDMTWEYQDPAMRQLAGA